MPDEPFDFSRKNAQPAPSDESRSDQQGDARPGVDKQKPGRSPIAKYVVLPLLLIFSLSIGSKALDWSGSFLGDIKMPSWRALLPSSAPKSEAVSELESESPSRTVVEYGGRTVEPTQSAPRQEAVQSAKLASPTRKRPLTIEVVRDADADCAEQIESVCFDEDSPLGQIKCTQERVRLWKTDAEAACPIIEDTPLANRATTRFVLPYDPICVAEIDAQCDDLEPEIRSVMCSQHMSRLYFKGGRRCPLRDGELRPFALRIIEYEEDG